MEQVYSKWKDLIEKKSMQRCVNSATIPTSNKEAISQAHLAIFRALGFF